jgi:hypothetical protein
MKALLQNVGVVLVASIIALIGIEIGVRIWGPDVLVLGNQNVFFKFDPVLGWANLPNIEGQFSRIEFSYPVKINSLGKDESASPCSVTVSPGASASLTASVSRKSSRR